MSNIVFNNINENFPVAGQDNDTQVFRDNFNSIKTALSVAKTEISDLQDNTARTDQASDFNYNVLTSVTLQDAYQRKKDYGSPITAPEQDVSFKEALYHIIKFGNNCSLILKDFPTAEVDVTGLGQIGKITLELYGDGTARTLTFSASGSTEFRKNSSGSWGGTSLNPSIVVTSDENPVFVEVWQHNSEIIFLNYLGQFE